MLILRKVWVCGLRIVCRIIGCVGLVCHPVSSNNQRSRYGSNDETHIGVVAAWRAGSMGISIGSLYWMSGSVLNKLGNEACAYECSIAVPLSKAVASWCWWTPAEGLTASSHRVQAWVS